MVALITGRCDAAVVKAESLIHARLFAVMGGLGRASHFDEGFAIDPELAAQIPSSLIGRPLSGDAAADLLTTLMIGSRQGPMVEADALAAFFGEGAPEGRRDITGDESRRLAGRPYAAS
jgi:hypothetical protein